MTTTRLYLFFALILFFNSGAQSQRFGGNQPAVKWSQIEGRAAKVIFTAGNEEAAKRVVALTNGLSVSRETILGGELRPISIILQNQPLISNAYVGLAPWRSEFFMTPLQNSLQLGSTGWMDNLAIHEFRHVHQFSNFRKGLSRFAYLVAGEEGQSLANAASIPDWFFEGDAVYTETKYLSQGRGRLPMFADPFNSIWAANKKYNYQKIRNGSLRDLIPDHYALGYLLVRHGYEKYGQDFWAKITDDAVRYKGLIYPFQRAIKKQTRKSFGEFVSEAFLESKLKNNLSFVNSLESILYNKFTKRVVDHKFPIYAGKDSILFLRNAYNEVPKWVVFLNNKSVVLGARDIGIDDYFTYKHGKIVYTAFRPDPRWQWKEFNDIVIFNLADKTRQWITSKQRYFSPDQSNDGTSIVAVHLDANASAKLHLIDINQKKIFQTLDNKEGDFLSYPCFSTNDKKVFVVARNKDGESGIVSYELSSGIKTNLFSFVNTPISFLRVSGDALIFSLTHDNRNEIWKYNLLNKQFQVLSSEQTGSYIGGIDPTGNKLVYSRPTANGEQLFIRNIENASNIDNLSTVKPIYPVSSLSSIESLLHAENTNEYTINPYRKSSNLINFHSWRPFYEQPEWSFTLYGQNPLNTFESSLKYVYNENEGSHRFGINGVYGGLYPWITGGTDYTFSRTFRDNKRNLKWNEWTGNMGFRIPLNFTRGKLFRNLDLSGQLYGVNLSYDPQSKPLLSDRWISYVQQKITWIVQTQQAKQHIFPHFALALRFQNRIAVGNTSANQLLNTGQIYLPGIGKNHSLVMGFSYQRRDTLNQYNFSNGFAMARGYPAVNYPRMWKSNFNYHLPLLYPDLGFANIVYFQRIRTNFFYDAMLVKSLRTGKTINLRSVGAEVFFDTRWWNQQPVSFGLRYSRLSDANRFTKLNANKWEFIMPINLIPN